jgi:hypothetical protein
MKSFQNRILAVAGLGLFAICANAGQAAAQSRVQGSFTLSHEVRWQNANLPAGDYTFSLSSTARMTPMIVRGPKGAVFELASVISERNTNQPSVLILEERGGTSFVREMYLASIGMQLDYNVPKIPKNEKELAQGPGTTEQVLVAMAGK